MLAHRAQHAPLFSDSGYLPLQVSGGRQSHVVAFARQVGDDFAVTVVPRLMFGRLDPGVLFAGPEFWGDTAIVLPSPLQAPKVEKLTGKLIEPGDEFTVAALLGDQPVAFVAPI